MWATVLTAVVAVAYPLEDLVTTFPVTFTSDVPFHSEVRDFFRVLGYTQLRRKEPALHVRGESEQP